MGTDSMTVGLSTGSGLTAESAGFTVTGALQLQFQLNLHRALIPTLDFASMGVDAIVVMPALAFSGSRRP
ncbi:MAG: hypothetical protein ACLU0O_09415 [Collinsella sp.]